MSNFFLGQILSVGFNFAPRGFAACNGQLLSIQQNAALFSLLGTFYGGNGQNTFALPDLRSRMPIHIGQGPGLSPYTIGQIGGEENHTLLLGEMATHSHPLVGSSNAGSSPVVSGNVPAKSAMYIKSPPDNAAATMNPAIIAPNGGGQPHTNIQPYLTINFVIALVGIFPSRN